jgi:anti-anti-sigma regulatory factor
MDQQIEVGPLQITLEPRGIWIAFSDSGSLMLEIPPAFEEQLRDVADEHKSSFAGKSVHLDLANLPAISSRQLGMILTVRDVMKPFGALQLHNVSASVKHLLRMTGTDRFFNLEP